MTASKKLSILLSNERKYMTINFNDLKKEIPYKYKPQSVKFGKATLVAYIDSRDVQDVLDEVCGPENWEDDYRIIDGTLFCTLAINVTGDPINPRWVSKTDCGVESNVEKQKGESSDAFKRAAVKWGVGRFLYKLKIFELPTKDYNGKERIATRDGKILWTAEEINEYINSLKNSVTSGQKTKKPRTSSGKYEKTTKEPTYNKHTYSEETIKRVTGVEKDGKKGKECLKAHLDDFNAEVKDRNFKKIQDLDDKMLNKLLDFIEDSKPNDI